MKSFVTTLLTGALAVTALGGCAELDSNAYNIDNDQATPGSAEDAIVGDKPKYDAKLWYVLPGTVSDFTDIASGPVNDWVVYRDGTVWTYSSETRKRIAVIPATPKPYVSIDYPSQTFGLVGLNTDRQIVVGLDRANPKVLSGPTGDMTTRIATRDLGLSRLEIWLARRTNSYSYYYQRGIYTLGQTTINWQQDSRKYCGAMGAYASGLGIDNQGFLYQTRFPNGPVAPSVRRFMPDVAAPMSSTPSCPSADDNLGVYTEHAYRGEGDAIDDAVYGIDMDINDFATFILDSNNDGDGNFANDRAVVVSIQPNDFSFPVAK